MIPYLLTEGGKRLRIPSKNLHQLDNNFTLVLRLICIWALFSSSYWQFATKSSFTYKGNPWG